MEDEERINLGLGLESTGPEHTSQIQNAWRQGRSEIRSSYFKKSFKLFELKC